MLLGGSEQAYSEVVQPRSTLPFSQADPLDKKLLYFEEIAGNYPPNIKTEDQLTKVKEEWNKTETELISRFTKSGESTDIELRLGHLYRYGHNLDIEGAWEKSDAHFRKAIDLSPDSIDAHIGLAVLYVNYDFNHAAKAEQLFKKAIELSKGQNTPSAVFFGLFFSYYYQGKLVDAINIADKYIEQNPKDEDMRRLRKIAQDVAEQAKDKNK